MQILYFNRENEKAINLSTSLNEIGTISCKPHIFIYILSKLLLSLKQVIGILKILLSHIFEKIKRFRIHEI